MAPNTEEDSGMVFSNKRGWPMELADKEPLRPPVYNPEDYASSLKKWGKKGNLGSQIPHYLSQSTGSLERISEQMNQQNKRQSSPSRKSNSSVRSGDEKQSKKDKDKDKELTLKMEKKDIKNKENTNRGLKSEQQKGFLSPILSLSPQNGEMSLRQFASVSELLGKLKVDLKLSFPSFVQEFVGDPIDGVTLLLELLRAVQLSQTSQLQRCPPQILRRALLDEHSCLVCLKHCLRCSDASRRLASSPAGLFTLAVCIMSSVTQSRIIALELLTKACEPQAGGHKAVSEALSTLRLRFGEPVRFRFLVGMLSSAGAIDLLATAMKFINVFLDSAPSLQQKVYIQAELEQAGFDSEMLRKTLPSNSESVKFELNKWEKNYFDVEKLHNKVAEVNVLHEKIHLLEKRIKILQEEKGILQSLEQCLKERCSELEEVSIKTNTTAKTPTKAFRTPRPEKDESTPAEDEGISSSEQELSQDEDCVKGVSYTSNFKKIENENRYPNPCALKNLKNRRSNMKESNVDDGNEIILQREDGEEEETTIDEVIEELENIANDAEAYENPTNDLGVEEKCLTYTKHTYIHQEKNFEESEIIPAILHPQPPKKAKSLVHIYFPGSDFDSQDRNKSEFFEDDSDTESSDSLLAATQEKKSNRKESSKSFNSFSSEDSPNYFEERNIDEEEIKRKHLKNVPEIIYKNKPAFYQINNSNETPLPRTPKVVPVPVKRSQTFHITTENKKTDIKPKPKMGVSGLDFQQKHWKYKKPEEVPSRRESFCESVLKEKTVFHNPNLERPSSRSIEKMDEGLDSLVDIVISTEDTKKPKLTNVEAPKNIGPRTRRSLAESSLFCPQYGKSKPEEPPKPAQRTSLSRNNSSSTPLHLPIEIKLSPVQVPQQPQVVYNFGIKPAKSADSLLTSTQNQRCPPDGSSSPVDFKNNEVYKQTKTFFGNPKFDSNNHRYFEGNYSGFQKEPKPPAQPPSKPNFLLGTYQSSKPNNIPKRKITGTVLQSINTFNNNAFLYRNNALSGLYSAGKKNNNNNTTEYNFSTKEKSTEIMRSSSSKSEKVTDSPSGLY